MRQADQAEPGLQHAGLRLPLPQLRQPLLQQIVARHQREARQPAPLEPAELLQTGLVVVRHQPQLRPRRCTPGRRQRRHHAATGHAHARQQLGHLCGQRRPLRLAGLAASQLGIEHQRDVQMRSTFLDDRGSAAVLQHRVARQVEAAHEAAARHLRLEVMADHADAMQRQPRLAPEPALQRRHQAGEGRDGRESPGQRTGHGVGVLHPQARHDQQRTRRWRLARDSGLVFSRHRGPPVHRPRSVPASGGARPGTPDPPSAAPARASGSRAGAR